MVWQPTVYGIVSDYVHSSSLFSATHIPRSI